MFSLKFKLEEKLYNTEITDKLDKPIDLLVDQALSVFSCLKSVESV